MKASAVIRIIALSILVIMLSVFLIRGIESDTYGFPFNFIKIGGITMGYDDKDYAIGGGKVSANGISDIDINWVAGEVKTELYDGSDIEIEETSDKTIDEDKRLRYKVEQEKLIINYQKSGVINFGIKVGSLNKRLTIRIPRSMAVDVLDIDSVSADVYVKDIKGRNIDCENVSGDLSLESATFESVDFESVSGSMYISGDFKEIDCESVSGDIKVSPEGRPNKLDIETVSGDIRVELFENDGFNARLDSVSGKLRCSFPASMEKKSAIYKNGGADFNFYSVSGDVEIIKK